MPERELSLADGFSGVEQRLVDVFAGEVRVLSQDLLVRHAVRDHRDHCRDREAQPADAGQAPHDVRVGGDALKGHAPMITAADPGNSAPYAWRVTGTQTPEPAAAGAIMPLTCAGAERGPTTEPVDLAIRVAVGLVIPCSLRVSPGVLRAL
jgi:hypothetical protein